MDKDLTIGIEEEFQIIDPETRDLRSYLTEMVSASGKMSDVELKQGRTLIVTAMSDLRVRALMAVLQETIAGCIGEPQITYRDVPQLDKRLRGSGPVRRARKQRRRRK